MNNEKDKYLTEVMGECWHELKAETSRVTIMRATGGAICTKCNEYWNYNSGTSRYNSQYNRNEVFPEKVNNNFSTWGGFGKLWEWSQKQDWFPELIRQTCYYEMCRNEFSKGNDSIIHPDRFAGSIYQFLKKENP